MKAVITVVGYDTVGILAKVAAVCADNNANIIDVTQSVMKEMFTMVMLVDISTLIADFATMQKELYALGDRIGMKIHVMHEEIFESMHHI